MTQPEPPITLDLDPSGYIAGLGQATQSTDGFGQSLRSTATTVNAMPAMLQQVTKHLPLAGFMAMTSVAANTQKQLAPLRATTKVLGSDFESLGKGMRQMAREIPIGNDGARQMTQTLIQMGVATKGQERTVTELGKVYSKLGAATGEGPLQLAAGMTQLARVTNSGFDPKRMQALGDSLTTVADKSGASATGILGFSRLIAPLASASGVGATKIMGISAAFSKLGDDGALGANAFNKMMGDLNKSVRDGSPMLANYASIVGKTQGQFLALAKSDPTEAITQVTEAIAKAGAAGPRLLEQLGLEGPRTARVFQGLSASGGLRQSVADSVGAFGNKSTEEGSREAYHNLVDSMQRFGSSVEQVTDSLGGPFLNMLTRVVNVSGGGVGVIRSATESRAMQTGLKLFADVGIPALLALRFLGGGVRATLLGQAATSGPVRGFAGGFARARADVMNKPVDETFAGRRLGGAAYVDLAEQAAATAHLPDGHPDKVTVGRGRMIGVNQAAERAGAYAARLVSGPPGGGPGIIGQIRGLGVGATAAYMRMNAEQARLARTPFQERNFRGTPSGPAFDAFKTNSEYNTYLREQGQLTRAQYLANQAANVRALGSNLGQEGLGRNLRTLGGGFAGMAGQTALAGGMALSRAGGALMTGLGGPVGIGITGAMIAMQLKGQSNEIEARRTAQAATATSFVDDYRVALGKATLAVNTFAGAMAEATKQAGVGKLSINQVQQLAAKGGVKSRVQDYTGMTPQAVANRVNLERQTGGIGEEEIQRIEADLFNSGFSAKQVEDFRSRLGNSAGDLTGDSSQLTGVVARDAAKRGGHGWRQKVGGFLGMANSYSARITHQSDTRGTIDTLTDEQVKSASQLVEGINRRFSQRSSMFSNEGAGKGYSREQQFKEINEAVAQALSVGNRDYAERLEKNFTEALGFKPMAFDSNKVQAKGFTQAFAASNKEFREGLYAEARGGANARPVLDQGWTFRTLRDAKNPLAQFFDQSGKGGAQQAVQALVGPSGKPEDPKTQLAAQNAVIDAALKSGMSLSTLNMAATHAANSLGDVTDANSAFIRQLRDAVGLRLADKMAQSSSTEAAKERITQAYDAATMAPLSTAGMEERKTQQGVLQQEKSAAIDRAQARVAQQREYQVQEKRSQDDFHEQMRYATEDYERSVTRLEEQGLISRGRTARQYRLAESRAVDDFNRQRKYAQDDFAKQMARASEDAAKAMYSPYSRIAVQQTWDAPNMLGNMTEQNQAIQAQLDNLTKLRGMKGGSNLIKLLDLNNPQNAQQLASMIGDLTQNPSVLAAMNKAASLRYKLGGQLANDRDNVAMQRPKDDFSLSMKRQSDAFALSQARARADYRTTIGDMINDQKLALTHMAEDRQTMVNRSTAANTKMLTRLHEDAKRADEEITRDMKTLSEDLQKIIKGQTIDFKTQVSSTLEGTLDIINEFGKGGKFANALAGISTAGIAQQLLTWDPAGALGAGTPHPPQSTPVKLDGNMPKGTGDVPGLLLPGGLGAPPTAPVYGPAIPKRALGGIATRAEIAMIAEAGNPEAIIPLDHRGAQVIADALHRFLTADDIRVMNASQGVTHVTYAGTTVHNTDYSQHFEHVTVVSQDPDEMGQKLQAKQRRANLTKPPQARK